MLKSEARLAALKLRLLVEVGVAESIDAVDEERDLAIMAASDFDL